MAPPGEKIMIKDKITSIRLTEKEQARINKKYGSLNTFVRELIDLEETGLIDIILKKKKEYLKKFKL